jgi:cell division protein ZapB
MNDALTERIERLLIRHEESRRTVVLLERQLNERTAERDSLQSRLQAASLRIDAVLQRLPTTSAPLLEETTE